MAENPFARLPIQERIVLAAKASPVLLAWLLAGGVGLTKGLVRVLEIAPAGRDPVVAASMLSEEVVRFSLIFIPLLALACGWVGYRLGSRAMMANSVTASELLELARVATDRTNAALLPWQVVGVLYFGAFLPSILHPRPGFSSDSGVSVGIAMSATCLGNMMLCKAVAGWCCSLGMDRDVRFANSLTRFRDLLICVTMAPFFVVGWAVLSVIAGVLVGALSPFDLWVPPILFVTHLASLPFAVRVVGRFQRRAQAEMLEQAEIEQRARRRNEWTPK